MSPSGKSHGKHFGTTGAGRAEQSRRALENAGRVEQARKQQTVAKALRWPLVAVGAGLVLLGVSFWLGGLGGSWHAGAQIVRFVGSMAVGIGAVYALFTLNRMRK